MTTLYDMNGPACQPGEATVWLAIAFPWREAVVNNKLFLWKQYQLQLVDLIVLGLQGSTLLLNEIPLGLLLLLADTYLHIQRNCDSSFVCKIMN
jgi:hypothetical protein